jgi:2-phosphosulfolactate phosphatase
MDINILHLMDGAKKARGLAVVIDVFRAFSLECYLTAANAEKIIPVGAKEEAYRLKQAHPGFILCGERHGKILEGFDYGNSPFQIKGVDFSGKTVIHTTSSGTQGLAAASGADEVVTGSLVNAGAIARYISARAPKTVSLICMGWEGLYDTDEDILCAQYIESLLRGKKTDITARIEALRQTDGARFFDPAQQESCPEEDFYLCTAPGIFDFVLKLDGGAMTRIDC